MPAPHRLASLFAAAPEVAIAELKTLLTAESGNVRATAEAIGITEAALHRWIQRWGLRGWLEEQFPASGRIAGAQKQRWSEKSTRPAKKDLA